jgi:Bacterial alpha-L-rhamnosidase 6 hairpin glycosidase domain
MKNWIIGSWLSALITLAITCTAAEPPARVTTQYIDAKISLNYPGFEGLSVDSLGKEHFPLVTMKEPPAPWPAIQSEQHGSRVEYRQLGENDSSPAQWAIEISTNEILLESHWSAEDPPQPFVMDADTGISHVTLLGWLETNGSIQLPALMHFPDQGTFQITANFPEAGPLGYATTRKETKITFPAATPEHPTVDYRLKVVSLYPEIPGIEADARFDGFRRNWLNIFQLNPQRRMLSNNAGSDTCGFCYYEYADIAEHTPPLAAGLTAWDMVRQTLDRIIAGATAVGMPGYSPLVIHREDRPECSADTFPSFLIAAEDYVHGTGDQAWLTGNYDKIKSWADDMLATDRNGNGLIKYLLSGNTGSWPAKIKYRPANWWDTLGFGHEDAYANALAYRALLGMDQLAQRANHPDDAARYRAAAAKLKAAYFTTFYDPKTGVLAGWRSADGQLHDYYFLFVNGIAIDYGLVPQDQANSIMDRLLAKMNEVGYTNFSLGLPGNLIPVPKADCMQYGPHDGFQIYENGGATACFSYFTVAALYHLGRIQDGDRILFPLLDAFARGDFQGFGSNHKSKDWKMWDGTCKGYEGLLNDNYYALLAVLDRQTALKHAQTGYRNVAFWTEPGVQIAVSSHSYRNNGAMTHDGDVCPLNRPFVSGDSAARCWFSSENEHLPQWVWLHFPGPRKIDKVILYAAGTNAVPSEFSGQYLADDTGKLETFVHVQHASFDPETHSCAIQFKPIVTDNFRLLIQRNTASVTPQSWIAALAQVEVYGSDATNPGRAELQAWQRVPVAKLKSRLRPTKFVPEIRDLGQTVDITTPWYRVVLDKARPRIVQLSWDSLGQGELGVNFLENAGACPVLEPVFDLRNSGRESALTNSRNDRAAGSLAGESSLPRLTRKGNVFHYAPVEVGAGAWEQVSIRADERGFDLELGAVANHTMTMRGGLFRFDFAANQTPTTFVCHPSDIMNYVETPAYLAAPDFGTARISRTGDDAAFYRTPSGLFPATTYWVDVTPHQPVDEDGLNQIGPRPWHTTLHFEVQRLEPLPALVGNDPRLKRFPKYSLDMVQWRPDTGIIANSVMSLPCGLAILFYAQEAVFAPHLENDISPMEMVGASVERYFEGAPGYQMPNRNVCAPDWSSSRETAAYLVISAWYDIRTIGGLKQLHPWLGPLECLANHIESQFNPDGLIYYRGSRTMWFDTYKIQGADAYCNAADYRAFQCMADLETLAGRADLAKRYQADANRIEAVYFKSFYNPKTGVLAGWRTEDGTLHDYMFPWVNGFAICQGLVPPDHAKAILQVLLAQLDKIDFHSYPLGLPTNLIPMSPADYASHTSGAPKKADGKDSWQVYMNGGATPALEYYVIQALYQTGQSDAAERLLWPLMESYEKGTFNTGIQLPGKKQRNPVGSAFYQWDGSRGRGEGYLPEDWDGVEALFTGHYGIGFDQNGYEFEPWSPLKGQKIKLNLPYMGRNVQYVPVTDKP